MKVLFFSSNFQGVRKISALLVCMLFVFIFVISPIKVQAEAFPIPPLWLPMNPYNSQGLEGNYVLLNDGQKKIVKEVLGAVNIVYLGFGGYALQMPINGIQATREFYQEYGSTFLNTFWSQIMGTSRAMTDFVGSTIYKASTYDTYEEYEQDTTPSVSAENHKYFQISPELTVAFKNWYRANGGVEDWQLQVKPFETNFNWNTSPLSGVKLEQYNQHVSALTGLHVKVNFGNDSLFNYTNAVSSFPHKYDLFLNTTTSTAYLTNNGSLPDTLWNLDSACTMVARSDGTIYPSSFTIVQTNFSNPAFSNFDTSSYVNMVRDIFNSFTNRNKALIVGVNYYDAVTYFNPTDIIDHVYVGADWLSKHEIYNIDDLNIGTSDSEYIQNIDDVGYVDINILIGQIADEVVNLREVVEESVLVKDIDMAIPYADSVKVAIDKYINQPESGVVIPVDIFGGLISANGPVSYLWFMTKPLVSYTGDLLGILTLDSDGTFQFTGLGYIVVGVVTVGIIGGLVTKCLL